MIRYLIILVSCLALTACDVWENEIFVLPKNYTGYIIVIYEQPQGKPKKLDGLSRVYEIPQSGVLLTQFGYKSGLSTFPEFYYEKILNSNRIPYTIEASSTELNKIMAFGGSVGTANRDLEGKHVVRYSLHYIGTKNQIDSAYEAAENLDIIKLAE